jgi:serine/threonine protein kinase
MSGYQLKYSLGSGSFGEVFLAEKDGTKFAIKKVRNADPTASQEIKILSSVSHSNIIKYFGHYLDRGMMCIVLEYADIGTLEKHTKTYPDKAEYNAWRFVDHLSGALQYLHAKQPKQILHRDLKPDNILGVTVWSERERGYRVSWKLADFGVAKLLNKDAQKAYYGAEYAGVPTYMAPEVYEDYEKYSEKSDVWSLGCLVAFHLNKGRHVFYTIYEVQAYGGQEYIIDNIVFEEYSGDLIELVLKMTKPNSDERPTAADVLKETRLNDRQEVGKHVG